MAIFTSNVMHSSDWITKPSGLDLPIFSTSHLWSNTWDQLCRLHNKNCHNHLQKLSDTAQTHHSGSLHFFCCLFPNTEWIILCEQRVWPQRSTTSGETEKTQTLRSPCKNRYIYIHTDTHTHTHTQTAQILEHWVTCGGRVSRQTWQCETVKRLWPCRTSPNPPPASRPHRAWWAAWA